MRGEKIEDVLICSNCKSIGYYKYEIGKDQLLICNNCSNEIAEVYCPECDVYGGFIKELQNHPKNWCCPYCNKKHDISSNFYRNPLIVKMKNTKMNVKKKNKNTNRNYYLKLFWERKYCYIIGYILALVIGLFGIENGIGTSELLALPIASSFIFGFIIYDVIFDVNNNFKKEGRGIIFTREGLFHLGLTFSTIIILGIIINVFDIK